MKKTKLMPIVLVSVLAFSSEAFAYVIGSTYTWNVSTPNYNPTATIHTGTINTSQLTTIGDYLGRSASQPNASSYGDSGVSVGWDDTWVGSVGNANTNGDALDGQWVQVYNDGGWWDLGAAFNKVAVFTAQDHGPYLGEGLEYRVFGTNSLWDLTSLSPQALISDIYLDGWRTHSVAEDSNGNGWLSDDITGVFSFGASYRYIWLQSWTPTGGFSEPEIDAVAGIRATMVPEPASLVLMGLGLAGLAFARKKSG